jgi:hypothetical protein
MADPKDKEPETQAAPAEQPAGRVEFDSRGNSVWKWAKDMIDSTSILLKRLDNKDLALEPTQKVPVMGGGKAKAGDKKGPGARRLELGLADSKGRETGGGFDPYNSRR